VKKVSPLAQFGCQAASKADIAVMAALLFTCPITQMKVQHWLDDDEDASEDDYEGITCQACAGVHFVNRKGRVSGSLDE
jgi:hypothetical protein